MSRPRISFACSCACFVLAMAAIAASARRAWAAGEVLAGVEVIYDRPADLADGGGPIVCLLDTEHPDVVRDDVKKKGASAYKNRLFRKDLERLSGVRCVLVHYTQVTRKDFTSPQLKAVVITARRKSIRAEYDKELFALIREIKIPTLGICGGHQMIAQAYGGKFEPMRSLKPGEADPRPQYHPGIFKEWGFMPVNVVHGDPLFAGFGNSLLIREFHAYEVTQLPAEFELLASTAETRVQVIKHKDKPLYGTQFHPERYDAEHRDGERLLRNFLRLAGLPAGAAAR